MNESSLKYLIDAKNALKIASSLSPHLNKICEFKEAKVNVEYLCKYFLANKEVNENE